MIKIVLACNTVACFSQLTVIYFVNMHERSASLTQTAAAGMHIREQQSTSTWNADKDLLQKHKIVLVSSNTNGKNF